MSFAADTVVTCSVTVHTQCCILISTCMVGNGLHAGAVIELLDLSDCSRGIACAATLAHQQSAGDETPVQTAIDAAAVT